MATKKVKPKYEEMIVSIEQVLEDLNDKNLPLEKAVDRYKEGMKLVEACTKTLDQVEKELRIIENDHE